MKSYGITVVALKRPDELEGIMMFTPLLAVLA
jgi:hypothetical protein